MPTEHMVALATVASVLFAAGSLLLFFRQWWEDQPRVRIDVVPDMTPFNVPGMDPTKPVITVNTINTGKYPVTVTHVYLETFSSWWNERRRRRKDLMWVPDPMPPGSGRRLPHVLGSGELFTGIIEQNGLDDFLSNGRIFVGVCVASRRRDFRRKIRRRRNGESSCN